jgi:YbgC/YbaW family acyl-CoA thioester hydrolase
VEILYEMKVAEEDLDAIGHVNNVRFVACLEDARGEWYKRAGISYEDMRNRKVGTVILKMDIIFLKEARLGDTLKFMTIPKKLGNKSFVLQQYIYNQSDELITETSVTSVMFDLLSRKSISVVEEIASNFPFES